MVPHIKCLMGVGLLLMGDQGAFNLKYLSFEIAKRFGSGKLYHCLLIVIISRKFDEPLKRYCSAPPCQHHHDDNYIYYDTPSSGNSRENICISVLYISGIMLNKCVYIITWQDGFSRIFVNVIPYGFIYLCNNKTHLYCVISRSS